jgi:hypothetical protein
MKIDGVCVRLDIESPPRIVPDQILASDVPFVLCVPDQARLNPELLVGYGN